MECGAEVKNYFKTNYLFTYLIYISKMKLLLFIVSSLYNFFYYFVLLCQYTTCHRI